MSIRNVLRMAADDLDMIRERDPSITSRTEALLHPALPAIWTYRVAHRLHLRRLRRTARALSAVARVVGGGIEIHPGARIGRGFFIDHGAGVVIGETAVIGENVTIFHQVTLGSVGWWHDRERPAGARRHPRVGDRVVIGANATLLGPITIGQDSVIGAQALVIEDVPSGSRVLAAAAGSRPRFRGGAAFVNGSDHSALGGFPTW
ncbi:serine O-acetyltransferase EpsC [Amycolatopsis pithecellobii]|uniref:Serine acetyltransferase n=1 Tax=Amycolatopsis pithecellobii TaxID=664692 RepID=A0A6N7Z8I7_9PSEU|nr:serine O-acetyltransferase EpsC [Amycolatopsis pithecellobii]MTD57880.1 serine acetyltransferase [Amycolatopsis pithecellobii]